VNKLSLLLVFALVTSAGAGYHFYDSRQQLAERLDTVVGSEIDVGFAQFMSLHHDQAIVMSQLMLEPQPSALKRFASSISNAQLAELGQMRGWLHLWEKPTLPTSRSMGWMLLGDEPPDDELKAYLLDCESSETGMPGLATIEQLNELRRMQGQARDRRFLEMMLAHHEGGLPMARFAQRNARVPAVRQLASRIILAQSEEITSIRMMLKMLDGQEAAQLENRQ